MVATLESTFQPPNAPIRQPQESTWESATTAAAMIMADKDHIVLDQDRLVVVILVSDIAIAIIVIKEIREIIESKEMIVLTAMTVIKEMLAPSVMIVINTMIVCSVTIVLNVIVVLTVKVVVLPDLDLVQDHVQDPNQSNKMQEIEKIY
jgi:hypothetical protein